MKLQKLLSLTRQAIDEYGMIQENDKIAVGISGGKDSLTLLYALSCLRKFYPHKFDIVAGTFYYRKLIFFYKSLHISLIQEKKWPDDCNTGTVKVCNWCKCMNSSLK